MLMHNKNEPETVSVDLKIDLASVRAHGIEKGDEAVMKRKQLWEVIVRMHYLSHELRDLEPDLGVSPEFTRLVSSLLSEWAIMAEEAAGETALPTIGRNLRSDHH